MTRYATLLAPFLAIGGLAFSSLHASAQNEAGGRSSTPRAAPQPQIPLEGVVDDPALRQQPARPLPGRAAQPRVTRPVAPRGAVAPNLRVTPPGTIPAQPAIPAQPGATPDPAGARIPHPVISQEGTIVLQGTVRTAQEREQIALLISRVPGVTQVYNLLRVAGEVVDDPAGASQAFPARPGVLPRPGIPQPGQRRGGAFPDPTQPRPPGTAPMPGEQPVRPQTPEAPRSME